MTLITSNQHGIKTNGLNIHIGILNYAIPHCFKDIEIWFEIGNIGLHYEVYSYKSTIPNNNNTDLSKIPIENNGSRLNNMYPKGESIRE